MRFQPNSKIIAIAAFAMMVTSVAFAAPTYAKETTANMLKVSPTRTDIAVDPGRTKIVKVTSTNPSDASISVKPVQNDFTADAAEDGTPAIFLDENKYATTNSLKRFLKPMNSFTLSAKESKTVEVPVVVPANAKAGGYFGALRFAPTATDTGGQVNLSASVASLILLRVNGAIDEKLDLTDFSVKQGGKERSILTNGNDVSMLVRFKNQSSVQLAPFGQISVKKGNKVVFQSDFNNKDPRDMVLPSSARKWNVGLTSINSFGHYRVSATFTYGEKNHTIEATQSFWIIPVPMIIGAAVILILIVLGIVLAVKRRNRRTNSVNVKRR